jgi:hypothetical protein
MCGRGNEGLAIITDIGKRPDAHAVSRDVKGINSPVFHLYSSLDRMVKLGSLASVTVTMQMNL